MSIEAMKQAIEHMEWSTPQGREAYWGLVKAIEEAEKKAQEFPKHFDTHQSKQAPMAHQDTQEKCRIETVPAQGGLLPHPPKREPLTEEQRNWIVATCPTPRHIIDTVERMHAIKGEA